jgi:hypothetical protein
MVIRCAEWLSALQNDYFRYAENKGKFPPVRAEIFVLIKKLEGF